MPNSCPVCGSEVVVEPSRPACDAPCPNCGHLLWFIREHFANQSGVKREQITLDSSFADDLNMDSLETVELVMELEEEFDIEISDEAVGKFTTVKDAIRYIDKQKRRSSGHEQKKKK